MKKTITMYELLGLIKDGKAPKKIKCYGLIYKLVYRDTIQGSYDYYSETQGYLTVNLSEQKYLSDILNVEVEILEPVEDEFIDIEEITQECFDNWTCAKHINYLIKNQKKIIERIK